MLSVSYCDHPLPVVHHAAYVVHLNNKFVNFV